MTMINSPIFILKIMWKKINSNWYGGEYGQKTKQNKTKQDY